MGNEVVSKKIVVQFVHDAVEMESAIYTLKEAEKECEKKKAVLIEESNEEWEWYEDESRNNKDCAEWLKKPSYSNNESKYPEKPKQPVYKSSFWGKLFACLCVAALIYIPACFVIGIIVGFCLEFSGVEYNDAMNDSVVNAVMIGTLCLGCAVSLIISLISEINSQRVYKKEYKDYEKALMAYPKICQEVDEREHKKEYNEFQAFYEKTKKEAKECYDSYLAAKEEIELLNYQIKNIVEKRQHIENNLAQFYKYGIIPPDYRTFDCVMMLDHIFRNDLADTMREAIDIYAEREFRGSVIRGMDKICSMLGRLSSEMSAISLRLDMINSSVVQMSDDLIRANQRLMKNQSKLIEESLKNRATTEELIKETQLGRYTNEKLLESNKRLEYYAEEYRMGRMPRDYMN